MQHSKQSRSLIDTGIRDTYLRILKVPAPRYPDQIRWSFQLIQHQGPSDKAVTIEYWTQYRITDEGLTAALRYAYALAGYRLRMGHDGDRGKEGLIPGAELPADCWPGLDYQPITVNNIVRYIREVRNDKITLGLPRHRVYFDQKGVQCQVNRRITKSGDVWYVAMRVSIPGTNRAITVSTKVLHEISQAWLSQQASEAITLRRYIEENFDLTARVISRLRQAPPDFQRDPAPEHITCEYVRDVAAWKAENLDSRFE